MKKGLIVVFAMFAISSSFAGPKLYIFDCGHLSFPDVGNFGITNEETDVREFMNNLIYIKDMLEKIKNNDKKT